MSVGGDVAIQGGYPAPGPFRSPRCRPALDPGADPLRGSGAFLRRGGRPAGRRRPAPSSIHTAGVVLLNPHALIGSRMLTLRRRAEFSFLPNNAITLAHQPNFSADGILSQSSLSLLYPSIRG